MILLRSAICFRLPARPAALIRPGWLLTGSPALASLWWARSAWTRQNGPKRTEGGGVLCWFKQKSCPDFERTVAAGPARSSGASRQVSGCIIYHRGPSRGPKNAADSADDRRDGRCCAGRRTRSGWRLGMQTRQTRQIRPVGRRVHEGEHNTSNVRLLLSSPC
jgi:hypothetical protein